MFRCLIGLHKYEVINEYDLKQFGTENIIGKVIVSRCKDCGKLKELVVRTSSTLY